MKNIKAILFTVFLPALLFAQTAQYPGAVATDAQLKIAANNLTTRLRSGITASDTIIAVSDASRITASMLLSIDNEIVSVSSVNGNYLTVVRGFDGTTAASHANNRPVEARIDAWHHNAVAAELKAIQTALGPSLANVPGNAGTLDVTSYEFAAIAPGIAITQGNNVLTITCPSGVSGTNTNHYLYIDQAAADTTAIITGAVTSSGLIHITAASHGFSTGNFVKITGVIGVPANGGWKITVTGANTFTLDGSTFAGAYVSGGSAARGDEPVLITGGTCTSGTAGTLIVQAANPHTSSFSLKSATGGLQEALNMGIAGGVNLRLGSGTLYGPVAFDSNAGANYTAIVGKGRWSSILTVDPGFPMAAGGVFILKANAVGQTLKDFKISFTQPDSTDYNTYSRWPVAVSGRNASRTEISGLLIERAWDCFDFRDNAGGSNFTDVWASAFGKGFRFDGSLDTIRVTGLHYWPFSLTANQSSVFMENDNILAMEIGRVDDLKIDNSLFISTQALDVSTGSLMVGDPNITVTNTSFDSRARVTLRAGEIRAIGSYFTLVSNATAPAIKHLGGVFTATGCWFYHVTPQSVPLISLEANGASSFYPVRPSFNIHNSFLWQYGGDVHLAETMIDINPSVATDLSFNNNRWAFVENANYVNPKVSVSGLANAIITGNSVSGKGAGTGDWLSIVSDTNNRITGNLAPGWTFTLPATLNNGTYEVANRRYGLGVQAAGAGGPGDVLSLYGADATKRKSFRINETTGALEVLNSAYASVVTQINDDGTLRQAGVAYSTLPAVDGTIAFCADCTVTSGANNTCTSGGTGALAIRLNGTYRCFKDQN